MSYKEWADGERLEADDLNAHIVFQTVPRFATTADRSAAIGTPTAGRLSYIPGRGIEIYEGGVWQPPMVALRAYSTAGRPSAASLSNGTGIFDTTLNKPVWAVGSDWRDATGTIV